MFGSYFIEIKMLNRLYVCIRITLLTDNFCVEVLLSRPAATNSANYRLTTGYEKNVADGVPDTLKPFVAYTQSGNATVSAVSIAIKPEIDINSISHK